jgi:hypothetical protein
VEDCVTDILTEAADRARICGAYELRFADGGVRYAYTLNGLMTEAAEQMAHGRRLDRVEQGGRILLQGEQLVSLLRSGSGVPGPAPAWLSRHAGSATPH